MAPSGFCPEKRLPRYACAEFIANKNPFGALRGFAKRVPRRRGCAEDRRAEARGKAFPPLGKMLFVCGFQFLQVLVGFGLLLFALGFFFLLLKEFVEGLVKDGWRYRL